MPRRRKLSPRQRRTQGMKPPLLVARSYALVLRVWLDEFLSLALQLDEWEQNPVAFSGRFDASEFVGKKIRGLTLFLEEKIDPASVGTAVAKFAKRVETKNGDEFRRVIGVSNKTIGITGNTVIAGKLITFRERNVSLIKSLVGQQLTDIQTLLEDAEKEAWRVEVLRSKIQESFGVSKSKADLLARDQVLKLNGQLTQERNKRAGITKYIWTTAGDERVRGNPTGVNPKGLHYDLDGTIQRWDSPPIISLDGRRGHPGDDYQCRCTAFPILDELDEGPGAS